jgi:hypothetical protein
VADGSGLVGDARDKAYEAAKKNFRNWQKGRQPTEDVGHELLKRLFLGIKLGLAEDKSHSLEEKEQLFEKIVQTANEAPGPFSALAAFFGPTDDTPAREIFVSFSVELDKLSAALSELNKTASLEDAKNWLRGTNWLDDAYWRFPEDGYDDPLLNRQRLQAATNATEFDLPPNFPPLKSRVLGCRHAHRDGVSLFG